MVVQQDAEPPPSACRGERREKTQAQTAVPGDSKAGAGNVRQGAIGHQQGDKPRGAHRTRAWERVEFTGRCVESRYA
ncbi:hypothetical protein MRX96_028406 [Rhipicephalus microplus]